MGRMRVKDKPLMANSQDQEKLPPQNTEAEKSLLGCLMIDPNAIYKVADFLFGKDFYKASHQKIYNTMLELFEKREPIDVLSVSAKLKGKNELDEIGGGSFLTELVNIVPTASHVLSYAKIVQQKRVLRELISAGFEISEMAQQEDEDVDNLLDRAEKKIFGIAQKTLSQNFIHIKDNLEETWQRIDELSKNQGGLRGIPTGFKSLDNILAGFQKSDLIILAARPSVGKCVSGDTEIILSNPGSVQTIEEVVRYKKKNILSLNENLKINSSLANDFINNGIQPVFKVRTASGREIEATSTHPFLTIDGWKPLSEIKIGEKVAVPRIIPIFGKQNLPDWQIKSLAYYIAEGGLTGSCPTFTNGNKSIAKDFVEAVKMFPDIKLRIDQKKPLKNCLTYVASAKKRDYCQQKKQLGKKLKKWIAENKLTQKKLAEKTGLCFGTISALLNGRTLPLKDNFIEILGCLNLNEKTHSMTLKEYEKILNQNSITNWLQSLGLMGKLATQKFIPPIIFQLKKEGIALFLNRLFACDGSFPKGKNGRYRLSYSSGSYKLIKQVQHLLLRFGVLNKVREKRIKINGKIIIVYEIESLDAPSLLKFIKEIGIYGKEKKLKEAEKHLQKTKLGWTQDTIPIEIWEKVARLKGARSWASLYREMGFPVAYNIHAFRRSPRRETVLKLAKALNSQELETLARSDIYWDKIADIMHSGEKQVYDLTVPGNHNFIANDFIVHNSSLAINIAQNVACLHKIPVGIFSLEMSKDQIIDRLISSQANIDSWRLRTGRLSDEGEYNDFERIQSAMAVLAEAPIYIDDASGTTVLQMRAMARRLAADKGLGLLIIDYLQLMEHRNPMMGLVQQVSENSRALKGMARELNIPVLVVSQLSRAVEQRTPSIPRLSDLRDSGSIEQDADVVMFIYREDRYKENSEKPGVADIIIAKHRNGPVGKVELYFDEARMVFRDIDKKYGE